MQCAHLSLANFRNYVRLELDLASDAVIVVGENAQGKSNLLEAIYCLATTKSFRAGSDRELINWDADGDLPFARLSARVIRASGPLRLDVTIAEGARREGSGPAAISKRFKVNGVPKRAFDVIGSVNVVHFAPQDVELVAGAPSARRRYLDITIAQVDARYVRTLAHYGKVLLQRNHLLRRIRDHQARPDQLPFWDDELVNAGSYIVMRRLDTVERLATLAHEAHRELAAQRELLGIGYRGTFTLESQPAPRPPLRERGTEGELSPSGRGGDNVDARLAAIASAFREALVAASQRETALGVSLVGPHRDDLAFEVNGRDVGVYGSRGQQRTVALALKIGEGAFMREQTGEWPILLLDDVMSELDELRRGQVLATVAAGQQVIVTTTDLAAIDPTFLARARVLRVEEGVIHPWWQADEARVPA